MRSAIYVRIADILIANQVVTPQKMDRLAALAKRVKLRVCVDQPDNGEQLSRAMHKAGATLGVLVEVDIGMSRCGVLPGEPAVALAQRIAKSPGLSFDGLQGYDGHLQMLPDAAERRRHRHRTRRRAARSHRHMRGRRRLVGRDPAVRACAARARRRPDGGEAPRATIAGVAGRGHPP